MEPLTSKICEYRPGMEGGWGQRGHPGSVLAVVQVAKQLVWALRWFSGTIWDWKKQAAFGDWVEGSLLNCGVLGGDVLGPFEWAVSVPLPSSGLGELDLNLVFWAQTAASRLSSPGLDILFCKMGISHSPPRIVLRFK